MMKKLLPFSALIAGLMLGGQAYAAGSTVGADGQITPVDCAVLDNNVTVQLSENVFAGYVCSNTAFRAGTCHTNGVNKETTQTCSWTSEVVDGVTVYTPNFTACGDTPPAEGADPIQVTATGRVGFRGASGGGTVGPAELGATDCDSNAVTGDIFMPTVN